MTADPYRDSIHIAAEPDLVFDYIWSAMASIAAVNCSLMLPPK